MRIGDLEHTTLCTLEAFKSENVIPTWTPYIPRGHLENIIRHGFAPDTTPEFRSPFLASAGKLLSANSRTVTGAALGFGVDEFGSNEIGPNLFLLR
jgi:hypothetical protein